MPDVSVGKETGKHHLVISGSLPVQQMAVYIYFLPVLAAPTKELLLLASMVTNLGAANYEFEYTIYESAAEDRKQYISLFISPFPHMPYVSYTESAFWFPVPQSGKLKVRFHNVHPGEPLPW